MSLKKSNPRTAPGAETLEIFAFDCVSIGNPSIFEGDKRAPLKLPVFPEFEPGFARVLEPLRAIFATTRPPTPMGAFVMNPKPALL